MYYGVGDNNTEVALMADIKEMTKAGFGGPVNMYVLLDRSPTDWGTPEGEFVDGPLGDLGDFSTGKVFHVEGDTLVEDLDIGEVDMSDPDTLAWFVDQVLTVAPAERTALFFGDHGAGAYAFGIDEDTGEGEKNLDAQTLATGLRAGLAPTDTRLDMVGFSACLMANFETTTWLSSSADYLLASEDLMPFNALQYDSLAALTADPTMDVTDLAGTLIDAYAGMHGSSDYADTSLSLTDLSKAAILDKAVGNLATALLEAEDYVGFKSVVADSTAMAPLDTSWGFLDLGDVARRLAQPGNPDTVRNAADAVFAAVDQAVVSSWEGLARTQTTGLSIAIPQSVDFYDAATYAVLGQPDWSAWLDALFSTASESGANTMWAADLPDVESLDSQGLVISAMLDPDAVEQYGLVNTLGLFGRPTDAAGFEVLLTYPGITDSGETGRVASSWAFQVFSLSDSSSETLPTTRLYPSEEIITGAISGTYEVDGQASDAEIDFAIDPESGELSNLTVWVIDGSGAWAEVSPQVGSTFTPVVFVVSPDGSSTESNALTPLSFDDGITVGQLNFTPGARVAAGLLAIDGGGGESTVFGFTEVPE